MHVDTERWAEAVRSKDARYDGWFFPADPVTGVYCRPGCPLEHPAPQDLTFHPSAAAAQQAGLRACERCRPDAAPGSPVWNGRDDPAARAMRLIQDGVVEREGVAGLAVRLGQGAERIEEMLRDETGAGPLALARAQQAQTARMLIEATTLPMPDVASAAGFAGEDELAAAVRRFLGVTPAELRSRARPAGTAATIALRLPFRTPLCPDNLYGHLVATAVPGVEEWRSGAYRRTLRLPYGHGIAELRPTDAAFVDARLTLSDLRDLTTAINRCRWTLDLDADPAAIDERLGADPVLAPLVRDSPGRRVPRTADGPEFAIRAMIGQQVSTAAARTHAGRLVAAHGRAVDDPDGGLTHLFPRPEDLLDLDPATIAFPRKRRDALLGLIAALADGSVDLSFGCDRAQARAGLAALAGIGPWTVEVIAMRVLGDPDAFIATDLGVKLAAAELGLPTTPAALGRRAAAWQPWRAYAVQHLWATGHHPINRMPGADEPRRTVQATREPGDV